MICECIRWTVCVIVPDKSAATLISAATQRLRPIVMTTFTTVTSAIPLVLAVGPGAESRMVIGVVIFAGVSLASIFTLFVVPGAYYWLCRNTGSPQEITQEIARQQAEIK